MARSRPRTLPEVAWAHAAPPLLLGACLARAHRTALDALRGLAVSCDARGVVPDLLLSFCRVGDIAVPVPRYQTRGAAGMDLHAALAEPVTIPPLGRAKIPT